MTLRDFKNMNTAETLQRKYRVQRNDGRGDLHCDRCSQLYFISTQILVLNLQQDNMVTRQEQFGQHKLFRDYPTGNTIVGPRQANAEAKRHNNGLLHPPFPFTQPSK